MSFLLYSFSFSCGCKFQFYSQNLVNFDINFEISTLFFNRKLKVYLIFSLLAAVMLVHINPLQTDGDVEKSPTPREVEFCFNIVLQWPEGRVNRVSHCAEWVIVQSESLTLGLRTRQPRLGPQAAPTRPLARWSASCSPRRSAPAGTTVKDTCSLSCSVV